MNAIKIFKKFPSFGGGRGGLIILFIINCSLLIAQPSFPPQGMLGDGSQGNPYQITDSSHLRTLADYANSGLNTKGKYYKLMNDIDLSGYANWTPIGGAPYGFSGNFDGNGKVVHNLTISRPQERLIGLFGGIYAEDSSCGHIENLGIVNCNILGKELVGGLAGSVFSGPYTPTHPYSSIYAFITNCFATGNVSGSGFPPSSPTGVGGLVGSVDHTSAANCYFMGNVSGAYNTTYVGGLFGGVGFSTVSNCYAIGSVNGYEGVGGLIGMGGGWVDGEYDYRPCIISNCYATNKVQGNALVGGLVGFMGYNSGMVIRNCIAANDLLLGAGAPSFYTSLPTTNRILGYNSGGTLQNNYALNTMVVQGGDGITSGLNTEDGMSIPMDSLKSFSFYNTWSNWYNYPWSITSPSGVWKICDKQDLPFLRWQGIDCYYDITASAGSNGNISPSGTVSVLENTNQTFIFTPNTCYETDSLWIDGVYSPDSIAVGSYTFKNVTKNHSIKVSLKKIEYFTPIMDTTCSNIPYLFGNHTLTSSGIYYDTLQTAQGCDSVIELTLTVNPAAFMSDSVAICEGYFYDFHGKLLSLADTYYDTLQTIHNCDSVIELILTVNPLPEIPTITKTDNVLTSSTSDSYQWYYNGVSILAATFQNYIYTENGKYSVAVTNEFGCTAISTEMDVNDVGIVETHCNASLRVYPNPTNGQLTIAISDLRHETVNVEIYDVVGQNVGTWRAASLQEEITIDISSLASGMYFLKVGNKTARFVKE